MNAPQRRRAETRNIKQAEYLKAVQHLSATGTSSSASPSKTWVVLKSGMVSYNVIDVKMSSEALFLVTS